MVNFNNAFAESTIGNINSVVYKIQKTTRKTKDGYFIGPWNNGFYEMAMEFKE